MSGRRTAATAARVLRQLRRDPRTIGLLLLVPVGLMTLLRFVFDSEPAAFDRVGCAGEIQLGRHADDYAKWTIDIMVKFRDHEKLQLLTGERQSGGVSLCGFATRVTVC